MIKQVSRNELRQKRHKRVRGKVQGTSQCPRLSVFRSNLNISAQIIDDEKGITLVSATTVNKDYEKKATIEGAKKVGEEIAKLAKAKKIKKVVFDRGGYLYHGRVKALAEAAREAGLQF